MSITLINPKSLGLNRSMQFLGNDLRYRIQKEVTVGGYALDLLNSYGVKGVTDEVEGALSNYLNDWQDISINNISFGSGYMSSLSFSSANDVKVKEYSASFTIYEEGNLDELNIPGLAPSDFKYINSISESFAKDQSQNRGTYNHDIKIQTIDNATSGNGIVIAKAVATTLFNSEDFTALEWGSGHKSTYSSYYTESYNRITNDCSFSKKYELNSGDINFLTSKKVSFDFGENGVVTVTESADFKSKWDTFDLCLASGKQSVAESFTNCSKAYDSYKDSNIAPSGLYDKPITKGFTQVEKEGMCSYTVTYSNDKFYVDRSCYWDYTRKIDIAENGVNSVSEDGNIIGPDVIDGLKKQKAADAFWKSDVKDSFKTNLTTFYNAYKSSKACPSAGLYLVQKSVTKNNRAGRVNYSCSYTDDKSRVGELDALIKKKTLECSTQGEQEIILSSNVLVAKVKEIKQEAKNNKNPNKTTSSVSLVGSRKTVLQNYIDYGKPLLCTKGTDHLNGASYSLDPITNSFKISADTFSVINS